MKTFITEVVRKTEKEYGFYEGPRITASSWKEAEKLAQEQSAVLLGVLG